MALAHHASLPQAPFAYEAASIRAANTNVFPTLATLPSTTFTTSTALTDLFAATSVAQQSPLDQSVPHTPDNTEIIVAVNTSLDHSMVRGRGRKCSVGIFSAILSYFTLSSIHGHYNDGKGNSSEKLEESRWIASSTSWLDRQSCRWFGICGALHLNKAGWLWKTQLVRDEQERLNPSETLETAPDFSSFWLSGKEDASTWSEDERALREIPSYVYEYTPYVHLFSGEEFWPGDIAEHLVHTTPYLNYTPIDNLKEERTVDNLDELNQYGRFTYLQSNDNVEERPEWLGGSENIPSSITGGPIEYTGPQMTPPNYPLPNVYEEDWWNVGDGDYKRRGGNRPNPYGPPAAAPTDTQKGEEMVHTRSKRKDKPSGGRSSAPAVLIVVPKGNGVIDAFWFYFYSYNLGNKVLNVRFGNHVGDWEHSVVRFKDGKPKAVFLSEHNFGEAYSYKAVEKIGKRPVIYSAVGSHAMYATPGLHPYILPWGLLHDETDRGPLWDPVQNHHAYVYNYTSTEIKSSTQTPKAPVSWFNFGGHWGDKFYPLSDPRQYRFAGQYHYVNGPYGPKVKNLGRQRICQGQGKCVIKHYLGGQRVKRWPSADEEKLNTEA